MNINVLVRNCYIASTFSIAAIVKQRKAFSERGHYNRRRSYIILQFDNSWIHDDLYQLQFLQNNDFIYEKPRSFLFDS